MPLRLRRVVRRLAPSGICVSIFRPSPAHPWHVWQSAFDRKMRMPAAISAGSGASGACALVSDTAMQGNATASERTATKRGEKRLLTVVLRESLGSVTQEARIIVERSANLQVRLTLARADLKVRTTCSLICDFSSRRGRAAESCRPKWVSFGDCEPAGTAFACWLIPLLKLQRVLLAPSSHRGFAHRSSVRSHPRKISCATGNTRTSSSCFNTCSKCLSAAPQTGSQPTHSRCSTNIRTSPQRSRPPSSLARARRRWPDRHAALLLAGRPRIELPRSRRRSVRHRQRVSERARKHLELADGDRQRVAVLRVVLRVRPLLRHGTAGGLLRAVRVRLV